MLQAIALLANENSPELVLERVAPRRLRRRGCGAARLFRTHHRRRPARRKARMPPASSAAVDEPRRVTVNVHVVRQREVGPGDLALERDDRVRDEVDRLPAARDTGSAGVTGRQAPCASGSVLIRPVRQYTASGFVRRHRCSRAPSGPARQEKACGSRLLAETAGAARRTADRRWSRRAVCAAVVAARPRPARTPRRLRGLRDGTRSTATVGPASHALTSGGEPARAGPARRRGRAPAPAGRRRARRASGRAAGARSRAAAGRRRARSARRPDRRAG